MSTESNSKLDRSRNSEAPISTDPRDQWMLDYEQRLNPTLITKLAHAAVPALEACNWQVTYVERGYAETLMPLNEPTTNQHGTHQAALISLSGDYTGGMAVATLLENVPLAGIHPCLPEQSASLWLVQMNVRYVEPSSGNMIAKCRVGRKKAELVTGRFNAGKRVIVTLPVEFYVASEMVASAEMTYFLQATKALMAGGPSHSPIVRQKLKASARMIAGVRAQLNSESSGEPIETNLQHSGQAKSNSRPIIRFDEPHTYDRTAATEHGLLLATKLCRNLPQLADFVDARTRHIDNLIEANLDAEQFVFIGVGLDMRTYRFASKMPQVKSFDLDLPEMLQERERILIQMQPQLERYSIAVDFAETDIAPLLNRHPKFSASKKTIFIYEGCSMYFDEDMNRRLLSSTQLLFDHPDSVLWCDFVDASVASGEITEPSVQAFLASMQRLGERFIFGSSEPERMLTEVGFDYVDQTTTATQLKKRAPQNGSKTPQKIDELFHLYRMCCAKKSIHI